MEEDRPSTLEKFKQCLKSNSLTISLISSIILGIIVGILIKLWIKSIDERTISYIEIPGEVLIRMLRCSAIPMIVACIIVALGKLDLSISKTISWQLIVLVVVLKFIAAIIGLILVLAIRPGRSGKKPKKQGEDMDHGTIVDIFLDLVRNILPPNMIAMYVQQVRTKIFLPMENMTEADERKWNVLVKTEPSMNILGMVFVSAVIGLSLSILGAKGKDLIDLSSSVYHISMEIASWVLWTAPVLMFFLIMNEILKISDYAEFAKTWGMFILTSLVSVVILLFVEFPIILFVLARQNIFKLYWKLSKALLTAFATASSMVTMPLVIEGLVELGVDERLVEFVVPVGISICKDGSAAYVVLATVFIADISHQTLSAGHYTSIVFLGALGSIAIPGVPFSVVVILVMVLTGLGMPPDMAVSILAVEWINDRVVTVVNIAGNIMNVILLENWNKKLLDASKTDD